MKKTLLVLAVAALPAVPAWGQRPFDQPWALIEPGQASTPHRQVPVGVTRIDGQSTRNAMRSDPIPPGRRQVTVSLSSSARAVVEEPVRTIEIDAEPCKRYRIVAQYQVAMTGRWDPVIQAVEDIGECRRRFMRDAPAK